MLTLDFRRWKLRHGILLLYNGGTDLEAEYLPKKRRYTIFFYEDQTEGEYLKEANSLADELASKSNVQSTNLAIDAKAVARAVSAEASSEASETKTINLGDLQNLLMERPLGEQVDILIEMIEATEVPLALARMVNAYFNH